MSKNVKQVNILNASGKETSYFYDDMIGSMKRLQDEAVKNGTADMSLDEINNEIFR